MIFLYAGCGLIFAGMVILGVKAVLFALGNENHKAIKF